MNCQTPLCTTVLVVAAVVVTATSDRAFGQLADTPWPTMNRDLQRTGRSPSIGPEEPIEKWRFLMEDLSIAGIAIGADGTIYTGDQAGWVYAVNPDGTERWRFQTVGFTIHSAGPTIAADGTIYIGTSGSPGGLHALNPDGTEQWHFETFHLYGSPAIDEDGNVYIGTRDGFIFALDPAGNELWRFGDPKETSYFGASPAIGHDGLLYTPTEVFAFDLYCLDRAGNEIWRSPGHFSYSGATIDEQGVIYTANDNSSGLIATNPDGSVRWVRSIGGSYGLPCIGPDGTVNVGGSTGFQAFTPDGTLRWSYPGSFYISRPIVDAAGTVYVTRDGRTIALRADGSLKWSLQTGSFDRSQLAMDRDGTVYVAGDGLVAIGPGVGLPCPLDLDDSGAIDFADLLTLLSAWGPCPHHAGCPEDLDDSGIVDFADLLILLAAWGPCE